ncbi:MAG: sigma-70 family RNA polymerase sigma factor [Pyrinomonadaceae bacterium]
MSNWKFSLFENKERQGMFFSKSISIDREELGSVVLTAQPASVGSYAEDEFIEKLKSGDAAAFDLFVTRYSDDLFGLLYRLTQDPEEASDLLQETFLSALKAIQKFRGEADLKTWLFRIAINESRNRHRWWKRRKKEKTFSLDAPVGESDTPYSDTMSGTTATPEDNALRQERERLLITALMKLPDIFREAIILCDIEGLSYEEIARTLEINLGTVKSRIARGREELRKKLEGI